MQIINIASWLCWILPIIGALTAIALRKGNRKALNATVIATALLSWIMTLLMIPNLFSGSSIDQSLAWFLIPGGSVEAGLLIDPLSIIIVNIVAFLSFLIIIYSAKYMADDQSIARFWFFMLLFISSMLLLVLADNFIMMFIGWKLVSLCSFGLIGYYYRDEKEHWIGGPSPLPFTKPSRNGLKALLITTFGDVGLLAGIIILYLYAHTFNFLQLFQTASTWLPQMAATPGVLALTCILLLLGPLAKSAQFPFHEWLPEAMSGPTPVSALIHAATMVKAGVYLIARMLPIFFFAAWVATPAYPEALTFFIIAAVIGTFTAFLGGTQAIVAKELKKALAYSTISNIGYMILALGIAGLSSNSLVAGTSSAVFFLINHGIFKVVLFLGAGVAIHASGSIYLSEMNLSPKKMRYTWLFMWIGALALMGVFPLSGFWSKDSVLIACFEGGQYAIFAVALLTVILTSVYAIRIMGLIFHTGTPDGNVHREHEFQDRTLPPEHVHGEEGPWIMVVPYAILAVLTVLIGLAGPYVGEFLSSTFQNYYTNSLGLTIASSTAASASVLSGLSLEIIVALASTVMFLIGAVPAYKYYLSSRAQPENILSKTGVKRGIYNFLLNRWYIDAFYRKVFVEPSIWLGGFVQRYIENPLDHAINSGVPRGFQAFSNTLKKLQTGKLRINMMYFLVFLVLITLTIFLLWLGGFF
jgi:NADH-quinone oxidoreductase subunit L